MGNKTTKHETSSNVIGTYSKLINMGFDDHVSMDAANKYPKNINKAINFITESQNIQNASIQYNEEQNENDEVKHEKYQTDNHMDKQIKYGNECKCIAACKSLERLIETLKFYQIYKNDNDKMMEYFIMNKHHIINDYHHILHGHLNEDNISKSEHDEQFKLIYNKIMNKNNNLCCDIKNCLVYTRNNREREKDKTSDDNKYINCLDSIHCFFLHSVDIGYQINFDFKHDTMIQKEKYSHICLDQELIQLKSYLNEKTKHLEQTRGFHRIQNNKFITQLIYTKTATENEQKDDGQKTKTSIQNEQKNNANDGVVDDDDKGTDYSFGKRYNYWLQNEGYDYDFKKVKPKYSSLKEELLGNTIYILEKHVFQSAFEKAKELMETSDVIKSIKAEADEHKYYGIEKGKPLTLQNILSIIFYTDYDTLSMKFSSTFRAIKVNESDDDILHRNKEYGNWCKYLVETVNCYGTGMNESNINVLYHGVSLIYFSAFIATFNSPTSTTTKLQIATIFAKNDGIILELNKYQNRMCYRNLRYFNCSFMSCFGNEDERLFIQPPESQHYYLKLVAIRNMKTDENYRYFVNVIIEFEQFLNVTKLTGGVEEMMNHNLSSKCIDTINDLMDLTNNTKTYPIYIVKSFQKWTEKIKIIYMDRIVTKNYVSGFKIWDLNKIGDKTEDNLLRYDKINKVFNQITKIVIGGIGTMNVSYLQSVLSNLKLVQELDYSKLEEIRLLTHTKDAIMFSILDFAEYESLFAQSGWKIEQKNDMIGDEYVVITRLF